MARRATGNCGSDGQSEYHRINSLVASLVLGLGLGLVACTPTVPHASSRAVDPAVVDLTVCDSVVPNETPFPRPVPAWLPPPVVPDSNPITASLVELGRVLFFSNALSLNDTMSCASCHKPELAFTDGRAQAVGATGELHPRSSMSLLNAAYNVRQGWASDETATLEDQIHKALFNTEPVELGWSGREQEQLAMIYRRHRDVVDASLGRAPTTEDVIRALASYTRTLIDTDSAYDRYVYTDDRSALTEVAKQGARLFFSNRLGCSVCHRGPHFGGTLLPGEEEGSLFASTGLGSERDPGLYGETSRQADWGLFRVPSLRNVAVTAPYMHDGRFRTLDEVIDHYARRGERPEREDPRLLGFDLTAGERRALIEFLQSLSGDFAQFSVP